MFFLISRPLSPEKEKTASFVDEFQSSRISNCRDTIGSAVQRVGSVSVIFLHTHRLEQLVCCFRVFFLFFFFSISGLSLGTCCGIRIKEVSHLAARPAVTKAGCGK